MCASFEKEVPRHEAPADYLSPPPLSCQSRCGVIIYKLTLPLGGGVRA